MRPEPGRASDEPSHEAYLAIERFLKASQKPVLIEPGDDPLPISTENFVLTEREKSVTLECWTHTRTLFRRIVRVKSEQRGRLELEIARFGGRIGTLTLVDLIEPINYDSSRKTTRLRYRERFRESLHRQFRDWRIIELSTEADLHHSLSPAYPRALLRKGTSGFAAIGAGEDAVSPDAALSFGLIWLDYLRTREKRLAIHGLAIFVPAGLEQTTCHRIRFLDPSVAQYLVFVHDSEGWEQQVEPSDYTNLETKLSLARKRSLLPVAGPEARLEARIRDQVDALDATLRRRPVYGQVVEFAGGHRGILDLLAIDCDGHLAVIELKASQDIHLPLQALDYWMRIKWHLDRGEFSARGYFPEISLLAKAPRLLLVAPALEFHPTNEIILRYFSPAITIERLGIGLQWEQEFKVLFRTHGNQCP